MDRRSSWLDISQVLFCVFIDRQKVEANKNTNRRSQYPAMWEISSMQDRPGRGEGGGGYFLVMAYGDVPLDGVAFS